MLISFILVLHFVVFGGKLKESVTKCAIVPYIVQNNFFHYRILVFVSLVTMVVKPKKNKNIMIKEPYKYNVNATSIETRETSSTTGHWLVNSSDSECWTEGEEEED